MLFPTILHNYQGLQWHIGFQPLFEKHLKIQNHYPRYLKLALDYPLPTTIDF